MNTAHWLELLPEAGDEASRIAEAIRVNQRIIAEAKEQIAALKKEADAYAAADWTDEEILDAKARSKIILDAMYSA